MVDRYTKIVLTVIALALVALATRPVFEARVARAAETVDVRIVDITGVLPVQILGVSRNAGLPAGPFLPPAALLVNCVSGCR